MARRRRRRSRGFLATPWPFALALGAAALLLAFLETKIAPLKAGAWAAYPTRVYCAPTRLKEGDWMLPEELEARLERLRYRRVEAEPQEPGQYWVSGSLYEIHARPFAHPFLAPKAPRGLVRLEDGRIASVRPQGRRDENASELYLEPELLHEISGPERIRRRPLKESDIPRAAIQALVAIEDRRFYAHRGIDARAITRAAWRNLRGRRIAEGGSTITQQLARSLFLSQKRTFRRKALEALYALYLDCRFSKERILHMYLDSVYFGQEGPVGIMGLAAAARHYFDKDPAALNTGECALLIGLLSSPRRYDPFHRPDAALERRRAVLAAMRREGFLDAAGEARALLEPLRLSRKGREAATREDYFLAHLRQGLEARYGDESILTRGLTLYTTLDPWLQERAARCVRAAPRQAALVALDARSGAIRALVGGRDYVESPYNRATQARRQPGSAFKPFVYGAALRAEGQETAYTPASLLSDTPRTLRLESGTWRPKNYDGRALGPIPLRKAFVESRNLATLDLAARIGPRRIVEYARLLGVRAKLEPDLGLALGVYELSLLNLTGAYAPFANGGSRVDPYAVEAALDADGNVLDYHAAAPLPVLSPSEAALMADLLRGVVREGTGRPLAAWGLDAVSAGKTGTTDEGKDAWFIGFTPRLLAGVWVGSDTPSRSEASGASAALPVWADFMSGALPRMPRPERPPSAPLVRVTIDPASGLRARWGCPRRTPELFLPGTEPTRACPLHPGGVSGWLKKILKRSGGP